MSPGHRGDQQQTKPIAPTFPKWTTHWPKIYRNYLRTHGDSSHGAVANEEKEIWAPCDAGAAKKPRQGEIQHAPQPKGKMQRRPPLDIRAQGITCDAIGRPVVGLPIYRRNNEKKGGAVGKPSRKDENKGENNNRLGNISEGKAN